MDASFAIDTLGREQGATGCRVPWWSFTKTLIATASFRAAELGVLKLDEPTPHGPTLRRLLRHEAGLPDYGRWPDYHEAVAAGREPWPALTVIDRGVAKRAPEGGWMYSNIGYAMAREILTGMVGKPLGEVLSEFVFEPAGVHSARVAESREDLAGVSGVTAGYHPGWVYHGLVVGDLADAARIIRALLAGALLDPRSLEEMQRPTLRPQFQTPVWRGPTYGVGLMAPGTVDGSRFYGHTGSGPGSDIAVYGVVGASGPAAVAVFSDQGADVERRAATALDELVHPEAG